MQGMPLREQLVATPFLVTTGVASAFFLVLLQVVIRAMGSVAGPFHPLDLRLFYAPSEVYATLRAMNPYARDMYGLWSLLDLAFPPLYVAFLGGLLRRLRGDGTWRIAAGIGLADWIENAAILAALQAFPRPVALAAWTAAVATPLKWGLTAVCAVALAWPRRAMRAS